MINPMVIKVVKVAVKVASIAVPIIAAHFDNKDLDEKITKKVAEAVANATTKES